MNVSSGHTGGLSQHSYHFIFFQMQLNGLAFVRSENEALPFLNCTFSLTTGVGKGTQIFPWHHNPSLLTVSSLSQLHSANAARPFSSGPITPASTGPGGKRNLFKKMEVHISISKSSLALPQTIRSVPWVN